MQATITSLDVLPEPTFRLPDTLIAPFGPTNEREASAFIPDSGSAQPVDLAPSNTFSEPHLFSAT